MTVGSRAAYSVSRSKEQAGTAASGEEEMTMSYGRSPKPGAGIVRKAPSVAGGAFLRQDAHSVFGSYATYFAKA